MSETLAEGIAALLIEHGAWRYTNGAGTSIVCRGCGAPVGNVIAHQAEVLAAKGYGRLSEPEPGADVCPYDCDSCHDEDCPCDRMGCAGSV